jgi:membrane fusion protein (multidrug efflux system)
MFTRVHIVHDTRKDTLLVPKDAILSEDADSWVFKVKKENTGSLAIKTKVTIGYINTTHVEILSGLQEGDTVVTTGLSTLKDGTKVKVI